VDFGTEVLSGPLVPLIQEGFIPVVVYNNLSDQNNGT